VPAVLDFEGDGKTPTSANMSAAGGVAWSPKEAKAIMLETSPPRCSTTSTAGPPRVGLSSTVQETRANLSRRLNERSASQVVPH